MNRSRPAPPVRLALLACPLALVLSACGGNDSADDPAPTVTVTQTVSDTPTDVSSDTAVPTSTPAEPTTGTSTGTGPTTVVPTTSVPTSAAPTSDDVDLSQPPGTFDAAIAHIAAATGSTQTNRFTSPSGNIYCGLKVPYVGAACELGEGGIPDTAYCGNGPASTAIGRIEIHHGTVTPVCNSDTIRTGARVPDLAYGTVSQVSGTAVECLSETIGMTCVDTSAESGFFLARGRYLVFGHGG